MACSNIAASTLDQFTNSFDKLVEDIYCSTCGEIYRQSSCGTIVFCDICNTSRPILETTKRPTGFSSTIYLGNDLTLRVKEILNFNNAGLLGKTTMICPDCGKPEIKKYCIPDRDKSNIGKNFIVCINCLKIAAKK